MDQGIATGGATGKRRRIDLNLLLVFEAIMHYRSVAAASRALGVTPSAGSHALARLRRTLGDELFIDTGSSMVPTGRALEMAPGIGDGLRRLHSALSGKTIGSG